MQRLFEGGVYLRAAFINLSTIMPINPNAINKKIILIIHESRGPSPVCHSYVVATFASTRVLDHLHRASEKH